MSFALQLFPFLFVFTHAFRQRRKMVRTAALWTAVLGAALAGASSIPSNASATEEMLAQFNVQTGQPDLPPDSE